MFPVTSRPVLLIVITLATPLTPAVMFPLSVAILTLLEPLLIAEPDPGGDHCNTPLPSVVSKYPVVPPVIMTLLTGPRLLKPVTFIFVTVSKLVRLSNVRFALPSN